MYNVRVKKFFDTEQIQVYSQMMQSNKEPKFDKETGEIIKRKRREPGTVMFNPLTGEYEKMVVWDEEEEKEKAERSKGVSHARTIHKIYDIARSNEWEWFITLTFNPDKVKRFDYADCTKKVSDWLSNARRKCPNMKYLVVPEIHKDGAWHFHGLFSDCSELGFVDSGHKYNGREVFNVGAYNFGWTTAIRIDDQHKTCSYLTKYVTKELCGLTKGKKRYWNSRNVKLPEVIDLVVENPKEFQRYMQERCNYIKKTRTEFVDVMYIEVGKGETDAILED